jgi:SAM-dependent methyltransferase
MTLPSEFDNTHFPLARKFINTTRTMFIDKFIQCEDIICDIGNQGKALPELESYNVVSLDINEESRPDIIADITMFNKHIPDQSYDALMCTEVLEHVVDPFAAIRELRRILKRNGYILFTTPLNVRIHGPIPDCWRFTEFGLKVLLRDFEIVYFDKLNTPGRNLFPIHYAAIVRNISYEVVESDPRLMKFEKVD